MAGDTSKQCRRRKKNLSHKFLWHKSIELLMLNTTYSTYMCMEFWFFFVFVRSFVRSLTIKLIVVRLFGIIFFFTYFACKILAIYVLVTTNNRKKNLHEFAIKPASNAWDYDTIMRMKFHLVIDLSRATTSLK